MKKLTDDELIDGNGGTMKVARLCNVAKCTVSSWRKRGIPEYRRFLLITALHWSDKKRLSYIKKNY